MTKQVKKDTESRTRMPEKAVPDKDKYTAGGPRERPRTPHADNPPKREAKREEVKTHDEEEHEAEVINAGKWKAEDEPPYARTYKEPLDEEGNAEE